LSRVIDHPGPTHGLFDLLAATVVTAAPGPKFLMLGFAAGGMVAPLRALGWRSPIEALDRSPIGTGLFRQLCGSWAGEVQLHRADAVAFLRRTRRRWDVILDDLSVLGADGVQKPEVCYDPLPGLIRARLRPGGVAIINALPHPAIEAPLATERLRASAPAALEIHTESYENRILLAADRLPSARSLSPSLRRALRRIGSRLATEISVRTRA